MNRDILYLCVRNICPAHYFLLYVIIPIPHIQYGLFCDLLSRVFSPSSFSLISYSSESSHRLSAFTLFSHWTEFNGNDQVPKLWNTIRSIEFPYILIYKILMVYQKTKSFGITSVITLIYHVTVVPKYLNTVTVWMDLCYDCSPNPDRDICM